MTPWVLEVVKLPAFRHFIDILDKRLYDTAHLLLRSVTLPEGTTHICDEVLTDFDHQVVYGGVLPLAVAPWDSPWGT